jgi:predicted kinase
VIVLVTGASATGKTTLAQSLAEHFGLPLFAKDRFKEMMFEAACPDGDYEERITREFSRLLGRMSMGCLEIALEQCVRAGVSSVFEANFDSRLFSPHLARLRSEHEFHVVQAHLSCRADMLLERYIRRETEDRHPGHGGLRFLEEDRAALLQGAAATNGPLILPEGDGELVAIDTTDFAAVDCGPLYAVVARRLERASGRQHD